MSDLADLTAEQLLAGYAQGAFSPVEALQAVTERVARENAAINAFAVLDKRALAAAGESAQRWRAGRPIGALDGVPCTVKDLVDIAGLPTRRGSRTTDPAPVADDAPMVLGLKAAGAVIVGKTTTASTSAAQRFPTAAAASASRRRGAGWSGSSRRSGGCRNGGWERSRRWR